MNELVKDAASRVDATPLILALISMAIYAVGVWRLSLGNYLGFWGLLVLGSALMVSSSSSFYSKRVEVSDVGRRNAVRSPSTK